MKQKILDILIVLALMAVSVLARIPTLSLPGMSYSDIADATDEAGYPYLSDPDSYYFARRVGDYAAEDSILPYAIPDTLRVVPSGEKTEHFDFFPYFMSLIFRLVNFFGDIPLGTFVVFAAPIVYSLSIIPAYIFVRKRAGRFGATFAGLAVGMNPAYFVDTNISCFDSDIVLFAFPLAFLCFFIEALEAKSRRSYIVYSVFSLLFLALLFSSWGTADVYLYLLMASFAAYFIWKWIEKHSFRAVFSDTTIRRFGIYLLVAMLVVFACRGTLISDSIFIAITSILGITVSADPSPAKYVSELGSPDLLIKTDWYRLDSGSVFSDAGGLIVVLIALGALIYFGVRACIDKRQSIFVLFFLWLAGTFFAASIANRFTKLLAIPVSLLFGLGMGLLYTFATKHHSRTELIFFSCLFLAIPLLGVALSCKGFHGSSDDTLVSVSRYIRDASVGDESPLIVAWWDEGYIYEYESGVTTLMDGGTYNGHFYQEVARVLLDDDPATSIDYLRSFLDEQNLHPDAIYLPLSKEYISYDKPFEYYANFGLDEEKYHMDGSILQRSKDSEDMGDYRFLTSFGRFYIYKLSL